MQLASSWLQRGKKTNYISLCIFHQRFQHSSVRWASFSTDVCLVIQFVSTLHTFTVYQYNYIHWYANTIVSMRMFMVDSKLYYHKIQCLICRIILRLSVYFQKTFTSWDRHRRISIYAAEIFRRKWKRQNKKFWYWNGWYNFYVVPWSTLNIVMMTSSNGNFFRVTGPLWWGIHRSPVNSPHEGQWRRALMFSLICAWINDWVNNREAGDLRRHRAHYDVNVMFSRVVKTSSAIERPLPVRYQVHIWQILTRVTLF